MNNIGFILILILSMRDIALLGVLVMSSLRDIALLGVLVMSSLIVYERYSLVRCACGCCLSYFFIIYFLLFGFFIFGYGELGLLNQGVHNFYLKVFTILFKERTFI